MKSNHCRYFYDNVCNKEVSVLCFENFFALVLFWCSKQQYQCVGSI